MRHRQQELPLATFGRREGCVQGIQRLGDIRDLRWPPRGEALIPLPACHSMGDSLSVAQRTREPSRDNVGNADGDNQAQRQSGRNSCEEFRAELSGDIDRLRQDHCTAGDRPTLDQYATSAAISTARRDRLTGEEGVEFIVADPRPLQRRRKTALARDQVSGDALPTQDPLQRSCDESIRWPAAIGSLHVRGGQIRQSLECSGGFCHGCAANERRYRDTSNDNSNGRDRRNQQDRLRDDPPPLAGLQSRPGRRRSRVFTHRRTLPRSSPRRALFGSDCHHRVWRAVGPHVRRRSGCPPRTRTPTLPRAVDLD